MSGLALRNIAKSYEGQTVIADLSLRVAEGELLVLVGPSGSGKSTLLRVIAGLIGQDRGEIEVAGRSVGQLPPDRRDIAMVFQSYALFPHLTVEDNLSFGLRARGESLVEGAERIRQVAEQLGLTALLRRFPRQLSGGERQRVALARALVRQPKLFLLDEPLSNLDAQLRVQTRAEILKLHRQLATTMVYVTHDQIEALSMGDRIGVLRGGVLEDIGTPTEIYARPANLFVARFLGSPSMNTFPARLDAEALQVGPWRMPVERDGIARQGEVIAGIRPEHISLQGSRWAQGEPPAVPLEGRVEVVEFAGDQRFLEIDFDGIELIARAEPEFAARPGDGVQFWFDPARIQLFDPHSERALRGRTA